VDRREQLTLSVYGADTGLAQLDTVRELFAEVYAEPPYCLGAGDVADFAADWPQRVAAPHFRLVLARYAGEPVGFAFGVQLGARTAWWNGALTPLSPHLITEWPGRTFAIMEIGVRLGYRRRGVARRMHAELIAGLTEERATLLVLPDAPVPRRAYLSWGYQPVGRIRPFPDGPVYDAMVKPLTGPGAAGADGCR
jgi:GNAT superfamily N-acetyltransferase